MSNVHTCLKAIIYNFFFLFIYLYIYLSIFLVDAQKDYHLRIGNTEGPGPEESWSPQPGPMYTEPPYRPGPMYTEPPYRPPPPPPQTPALPLDTPRPFIPYITTTSTPYQAPPTKRPPQTRPPGIFLNYLVL